MTSWGRGASNLKQKDVSSHITVNFKLAHTWHNILVLHLRNTFGVINSFNMLRHKDLSWLFMFLEIAGGGGGGVNQVRFTLKYCYVVSEIFSWVTLLILSRQVSTTVKLKLSMKS